MKRLLVALFVLVAPLVHASTILESTDSIEIVTTSTEAIDYTASWADNTTTTFTPGKSAGQISSITTTTIVAAPAASTQRSVLQITLYNAGAATNTLTVQRDVSAANRVMFKATLIANERLQYEDKNGWTIYDSNGLAKVGGGLIPTGTGYRHVTAGVEDAASDTVTFANSSEVAANQGTTAQVLHGNAAGQPTFGNVASTDFGANLLALANGGTNASAAASNGGVIYSDATKWLPSAVGVLGQGLVSGGAGAPTWGDSDRVVRLTADYTNASSALTNTALTWTSPASVSRSGFSCYLMVKSSATTAGEQFDVTSSVAPTTITYQLRYTITVGTAPSTTGTEGFVTAQANSILLGPAGVALTTYSMFYLTGVIVHTASASTVTIRGKNGAAGTITVGSGSFCEYYVL